MNTRRLAICLSAAVLALPSLAVAGEDTSIVAVGHAKYGWLTTSGPDASGLYRVSVNVADLDPTTPAGWSAMAARAKRGAMELCDINADGTDMPGYANASLRNCLREANDAAAQQMTAARDASLQGRPVATLGMAR